MKFYLDEGISPAVGTPLRAVFAQHEFVDTHGEHLAGMKDLALFEQMRLRHVDVFIALDSRQLRRADEVKAIRSAGCHWFGLAQPSAAGVTALARQAASLLVAISHLLEDPPDQPTAFVIKAAGRQTGQLFARRIPVAETLTR